MAQRPVELILMRQLAASLSVPVCLVDEQGALLYCNDPAERLLGLQLDTAGGLTLSEWTALLSPLDAAALPLSAAMREQRPVHRVVEVTDCNGLARRIAVTAFPAARQNGRHLGAVAIFWDA